MTDEIWKRDEIDSPCQKICLVHPEARLCIGCHRTPEEIAMWSRMTPERRRAIMAELPARAPLLTAAARANRGRRRRVEEA